MADNPVTKAVKVGFVKMVESACDGASAKMTGATKLTEQEKQGVKGLLCESLTFVAGIATERSVSVSEVGMHLLTNGANMSKLTKSQQLYCSALKAEMAVNAAKLGMIGAATYAATLAGLKVGAVSGGITGSVVAGPAGTLPGAGIGMVAMGGGALAVGTYEMYETVTTITNLAIDHNQQCGPLVFDKIEPQRNPLPAPALR
ncbi:hypothetical protein [Sphingomonas radiodurans]|uniref:hypothetical protein n=1 Tax=Sphingomonas radiodurans TaxID=2890321 RepID=UPI001E5B6AB7|nr:hypothetical protein [Sphingomonas radiodurans]WBH16412.1 hypothetical protein LLW23_16730 [Sphingomonas radiodurans]